MTSIDTKQLGDLNMKTVVLETGTRTIEIAVEDSKCSNESLIKHYIHFAKIFMGVVSVKNAYVK